MTSIDPRFLNLDLSKPLEGSIVTSLLHSGYNISTNKTSDGSQSLNITASQAGNTDIIRASRPDSGFALPTNITPLFLIGGGLLILLLLLKK